VRFGEISPGAAGGFNGGGGGGGWFGGGGGGGDDSETEDDGGGAAVAAPASGRRVSRSSPACVRGDGVVTITFDPAAGGCPVEPPPAVVAEPRFTG
jgi:hypothetical protein